MQKLVNDECAKFRGLHVILGLMCLVPSCHHVFVGIFWVQKYFFSWLLMEPKFLSSIYWSPHFFWLVFHGSKILTRGYFGGPNFFVVGLKFSLVCNFVIFSCWPHEKNWHRNMSETTYSFPNRFQQLWILFISERYIIN